MESRKRFRQSKIVISNGRGYIYFYKRGKFIGKGRFDIEDLPIIEKYTWHMSFYGYVATRFTDYSSLFLHRLLLNPAKNLDVDHINLDRLDNRRENLRLCSRSQNKMNVIRRKDNKCGFKGVCWNSINRNYVVQITPNGDGKRKHVGVFSTKIEAAIAYNKAARKYFGKFARYNKWLIGRCQDEKYYRKN